MAGAMHALQDSADLWAANGGSAESVIRAAVDVVAEGEGGDDLVDLAGLSYRWPVWDFGHKVERALAEVGLPFHPHGSDEALLGVLRLMAREVQAGRMSPRDLARWAHQTVGHDGLGEAQALVNLDDRYDLASDWPEDPSVIEEEVLREVQGWPSTAESSGRRARAERGAGHHPSLGGVGT